MDEIRLTVTILQQAVLSTHTSQRDQISNSYG